MLQKMWMFSQKCEHHEMVRAVSCGLPLGRGALRARWRCLSLCSTLIWAARCVQPPPGTFGGTLGLGGADGFGGTGENNVMYAGGCAPACSFLRAGRVRVCPLECLLTAAAVPAGEPKTKVDKMFGFALPPDARAARTQVRAARRIALLTCESSPGPLVDQRPRDGLACEAGWRAQAACASRVRKPRAARAARRPCGRQARTLTYVSLTPASAWQGLWDISDEPAIALPL